jgi:hypothetical protein
MGIETVSRAPDAETVREQLRDHKEQIKRRELNEALTKLEARGELSAVRFERKRPIARVPSPMTRDSQLQDTSPDGLTESQRWSVLRMAGLAISLTFTLPLYYSIAAVFPPAVVHAVMAFGLLIGGTATLVYARILERGPSKEHAEGPPEYGVNDRRERRNL